MAHTNVIRRPIRAVRDVISARGRLHLETEPIPSAVRGVRRQVRAWLADAHVGGDDAENLVLIVSELTSNAIEASPLPPPSVPVDLMLSAEAGVVTVEVVDGGAGFAFAAEDVRLPAAQAERGRGLAIVQDLCGNLSVHRRHGYTHVRCEYAPSV